MDVVAASSFLSPDNESSIAVAAVVDVDKHVKFRKKRIYELCAVPFIFPTGN